MAIGGRTTEVARRDGRVMGLLQFFGILTALDCADDLISIGLIGMLIGVILGAVGYHLLKNLD